MTTSTLPPGDDSPARGTTGVALALVVGAAFVVRILWWRVFVEVAENEGVVYARLAENLFAGHGYVGIFGGRDVAFPPLFPMLIGLLSGVVGSAELAARLIGLVCGTALVVVVHALARYQWNDRAAMVVAALAAMHPLLIAVSVSMYSEGPWMFLIACAAYAAVRALYEPSPRFPIAAGLASGAAYVIRPEGMAIVLYLAAALTAAGVVQRRRPKAIARTGVMFVAASLVCALPYILHLSALTGGFRWEGKSVYNNALNVRVRAGSTVPEATRGLKSDGSPDGSFLTLHLDQASWLRAAADGAPGLVETLVTGAGPRARRVARMTLSAGFISAPWILPLVVIGALCTPWWRRHLWGGLLLVGLSALHAALLLAVDQAWSRYFFGFLPLFLVWAGVALEWGGATLSAVLWREREWRHRAANGLCFLGVAVLVLAAVAPVRRVSDLGQAEDRAGKEIGQWVAEDARRRGITGQPVVMGIFLNVAYYAGGVGALSAVRTRAGGAGVRAPHAAALRGRAGE